MTGGNCAKCGTQLSGEAAFCSVCGSPIGGDEKLREEQRAHKTTSDGEVSDSPAPAAAAQQSTLAPQQPRLEDSGSSHEAVQHEPRWLVRLFGGSPLSRAVEAFAALATVIAIVAGAGKYLVEADDRHQRTVDEAWQVISSAEGHAGSGGRVSALEFLNEDDQSLVGVSVRGSFLENLDLEDATLDWADFQEAALDGANLRKAQLWKANLRAAYLGASLDEEGNVARKANLDDANLDGADVRNTYLADALLRNTKLRFANMQGAVLDDADLRGAKLGDANLQQASLRRADLQDASLDGANLQDADLRGADLRGAKNLYPTQLEEVIGNENTHLPQYVHRPLSWKQGTELPLSFEPEDPPLPPKEYSSKAFEPAMRFTVDEGWRAKSDMRDQVVLTYGLGSGSVSHDLSFINVQEVFKPSAPTYNLRRASLANVLPPPDDIVPWLRNHPYLDTRNLVEESVDGKPAMELDVVVDFTPSNYPPTCQRPCVPLFRDSQGGRGLCMRDIRAG